MAVFPMIGKYFSNNWKNFREAAKDTKSTKKSGVREGRGRRADGNLQERGENRFADGNALGGWFLRQPSIRRGATWRSHLPVREIMENIGIFACFFAIHPPRGRAANPPAPHPHPSRFSMSAKRFSWFSMLASLPGLSALDGREELGIGRGVKGRWGLVRGRSGSDRQRRRGPLR